MQRDDYDDSGGGSFLYLLAGFGLGALFMYLTDPDMGRRRRALLRDQYSHAKRVVQDSAEAKVRDVTNRVHGVIAKAQSTLEERQAQRNAGGTPEIQ